MGGSNAGRPNSESMPTDGAAGNVFEARLPGCLAAIVEVLRQHWSKNKIASHHGQARFLCRRKQHVDFRTFQVTALGRGQSKMAQAWQNGRHVHEAHGEDRGQRA